MYDQIFKNKGVHDLCETKKICGSKKGYKKLMNNNINIIFNIYNKYDVYKYFYIIWRNLKNLISI